MKIAMMTLTLIVAVSVSSSAVGWYSAVAAYGAYQEHALKGLHCAINGDCRNWESVASKSYESTEPTTTACLFNIKEKAQRKSIVQTYKPGPQPFCAKIP